jgi:hypothetical protein
LIEVITVLRKELEGRDIADKTAREAKREKSQMRYPMTLERDLEKIELSDRHPASLNYSIRSHQGRLGEKE